MTPPQKTSLSDKEVEAMLYENGKPSKIIGAFYPASYVREAVKELRERLRVHNFEKLTKAQTLDVVLKDIKEIFGEKLT